jgi:predicted dehydrogenase
VHQRRGRRPERPAKPGHRGLRRAGDENLDKVAGENIVALCDVDEKRAADAFQRFPQAKRFRDYRKMFDALHQQIDGVVVSIPDHMHAPVSLAAIELGKHVYCEKPLTYGSSPGQR